MVTEKREKKKERMKAEIAANKEESATNETKLWYRLGVFLKFHYLSINTLFYVTLIF